MFWNASPNPQNKAALSFFRAKVPMSKVAHDKLTAEAQAQAFTVANVANLDVIAHVWDAIDHAIENGDSLDDFREQVGETLLKAWGGSVANPGSRIECIFRTNMQTAYSAGRYERMTDPDVLEAFPVWLFDDVHDSRESAICRAAGGVELPADDPWWNSHHPPLHHNCRSSIIALTADEASPERKTPPSMHAAEGFGNPVKLRTWAPSPQDYPTELWTAYDKHSNAKGGGINTP